MAISGDFFFKSSKNSFLISLKYCQKNYLTIHIIQFASIIAKLTISIVNSWVFYLMLLMKKEVFILGDIIVPILIIAIVSYCICELFFGLYDKIILVLLLSIAIDKDMNKGQPKYGSKFVKNGMKEIYKFHDDQNKQNSVQK